MGEIRQNFPNSLTEKVQIVKVEGKHTDNL